MVSRASRFRNYFFATFATALIACDSGQEPNPELDVKIEARFPEPPEIEILDGTPRVYCFAEIVARGRGPSGQHVEWRGAEFRLSAGTNRDSVLTTFPISAEEVDNSFDGGRLQASLELTSHWKITTSFPITLTAVYDYTVQPAGIMKQTEPVRADCGPSMPRGGVPAPQITAFELTTRDTLQPGDRLTFTLNADSPSDIWLTGIQITGAFELDSMFAEIPRTSVVRSGDIIIPPHAALGEPLRVRMYAYDAFMQYSFSQTVTTVRITDERAPVTAPTITNVHGRYAPGDVLRPAFEITDNGGLAWIVYEFAGATTWRDSVPATGLHANTLNLTVREEWIGQPQLRIYGRDLAGNIGAAAVSAPIDIHRVVQRPLRRVTLRDGVDDYAYDAASGRVYVSGFTAKVRVLDVATGIQVDSIVTPAAIRSLDFTGDSSKLVMVPDGRPQLLIHDLVSRQTTAIDLHTADNTPRYAGLISVSGNDRAIVTLYGSAQDPPNAILTHEVDLADGLTRPATGAGYRFTTSLKRNSDGSIIVAWSPGGQCFQVWRRAQGAFGPCTTDPSGLWAMNDDASRFITGTHITGATLSPLVAHGFEYIMAASFSLDGQFAYIATARGLYKLDALTGLTIELDQAFKILPSTRLSPDGKVFFGRENSDLLIGGAR